MSQSMLDRAYERRSAFDFSDEYGMDPVRARYGTSSADVRRAVEQKELDLNVRNQEASILGQQLRNASVAAEASYKLRQQAETDAQVADAFEQLSNANDLSALAKISEQFRAAQRDEVFRNAFVERKSMLESAETSRLEAAKFGALDAFERRVNPPAVALGGSVNATTVEPMDPRRALAEAVDETLTTATEGQLKARGVEIPKLPDGTPDRATMATLRAEMDADKLEPEERTFVLEKWKMLARNVSDIAYPWTDDQEKRNAIEEMKGLEELLDPLKRRKRGSGAAPSSTIPNDDYFTP